MKTNTCLKRPSSQLEATIFYLKIKTVRVWNTLKWYKKKLQVLFFFLSYLRLNLRSKIYLKVMAKKLVYINDSKCLPKTS